MVNPKVNRGCIFAIALVAVISTGRTGAEGVVQAACARQDIFEYAGAVRVKNCLYADPSAAKASEGELIVAGSVTVENIADKDLILEFDDEYFRGDVVFLLCGGERVSRVKPAPRLHDQSYVPPKKHEYRLRVGGARNFDFKIADVLERGVVEGAVCSAVMGGTIPFRYLSEPAGSALLTRHQDDIRLGVFPAKSVFENFRIR